MARLLEAEYRKLNAAQAQIERRTSHLRDISLIFGGGQRAAGADLRRGHRAHGVAADPPAGMADRRTGPRVLAHAGGPGGHGAPLLARTARRTRPIADGGQDEPQRAGRRRRRRARTPGARLADCLHLVDEAIGNVRQMSQLLRPTILDDFGLEAGLRWLAEGFAARTGIEVTVDSNYSGRLPDETETHLFRIAQEALTNIARHAGAQHVQMKLASNGGDIRLTIQDDGRGLSGAPTTAGRGLGLIGMRARARSAGGDVTVHSRAGRGCSN